MGRTRSTTVDPGPKQPIVPDDDGSLEDEGEHAGRRRSYRERIEELDERIEYLVAERQRLAIEEVAERCKKWPSLRPWGRKLRAMIRAGLRERAAKMVAELLPELTALEELETP